MAPRASSTATTHAPPLPKVSFRKIENDKSDRPPMVHDAQARSFGYIDSDDFTMPVHYIRHIEPIESELANQVEYDMDEQDQEWLDAINNERRKEQLDQISYETFEIIMDRLEKEWFELMKRVPKQDTALPSEDSTCAICDDGEGENSNAIVFCDGCNLAVHQDCYGVPYIPEGQWLCRKCTVAPETPVSCILCPNEGGAFKQTTEAKWAHLLCAIWVPEVVVGNQVFMEPIDHVSKIPKSRWKLSCSLCSHRMGACIQCDNRSCFTAFHVTCARKHGLLMPMKTLPDHNNPVPQEVPLRAYCEKHLSDDMKAVRPPRIEEETEAGAMSPTAAKSNKAARAYAKTYHLGPPLVPALIVSRLTEYINRIAMRKKPIFLLSVCKYWSLKREARRGAPLLKRLHLEPWTASSVSKQQTDESKQRRLQHLTRLRGDLEKVRMLAELARKREKEKNRQAQAISSVVESSMFPYVPALRAAFEQITSSDRLRVFSNPVSKEEAPDYDLIVKKPMNWERIRTKLDLREYANIDDFKVDINLVFDNSILYNKPDHPYHKLAVRHKASSAVILDRLVAPVAPGPSTEVGDLEPSLEILRLLCSSDTLSNSTDLVVEPDPLASVFNMEIERRRTPPPIRIRVRPPPAPPKLTRAAERAAERERERKAQGDLTDASSQLALDFAPGFRARVTRSTRAAELAAEQSVLAESQETLSQTEKEEEPINEVPSSVLSPPPVVQAQVEVIPRFKVYRVAPPRTRSARALAALYEAEANDPPPEIAAAAKKEAADEAAALKRQLARDTRKRKREPEPSDSAHSLGLPQFVEEVDNKQSFMMFNEGWVLPAGSRRGNRPPSDRTPLPVRQRGEPGGGTMPEDEGSHSAVTADRKKSRLSVSTVLPQEAFTPDPTTKNEMLDSTPGAGISYVPVALEAGPMDVDQIHLPAHVEELPTENHPVEPPTEDLPIPALQRSDYVITSSTPSTTLGSDPSLTPVWPQRISLPPGQRDVSDSELSELSDMEGGGQSVSQEQVAPVSSLSQARDDTNDSERAESPTAPLVIGEHLPGGTLVWAKAPTFPYWPAVVYEEDDKSVSSDVLRTYRQMSKDEKSKGDRRLYIVQFYDQKKSWTIANQDEVKLLGEDDEIDQGLLKAKFKTAKLRSECHKAYHDAYQELDIDARAEERRRRSGTSI